MNILKNILFKIFIDKKLKLSKKHLILSLQTYSNINKIVIIEMGKQ